jgi:four helix bundle protein
MFKFEKLQIWEDAIAYGEKIYKVTDRFPKSEEFGLKIQLKRAVVSVSSNLAEGSGSSTNKHFSHFLDIAMSSLIETVSQLMFAERLNYMDKNDLNVLYMEAEILMKKMQAFKKSLFVINNKL